MGPLSVSLNQLKWMEIPDGWVVRCYPLLTKGAVLESLVVLAGYV